MICPRVPLLAASVKGPLSLPSFTDLLCAVEQGTGLAVAAIPLPA